MNTKYIKVFLRLSIAIGFLSAVADRFGLYAKEISAWGNWQAFVDYTQQMNPWFPDSIIPALAILATALEIIFAIGLLIGFKTELFAKLSGVLVLLFGLSMSVAFGVKTALDYSVFGVAAAAFALSTMQSKHLEIDSLIYNKGK
jgi:uncharacterized membrane protein YphA (DoxX/SURF4 family)